MKKLLAQDWIGVEEIQPPVGSEGYEAGLESFINRGFRLVFVVFGLYVLLNFILAAFNYINAQGEKEKIEKAQKMMTQSLIGLFLIALTFIIAGIIGSVFFGGWDALLDINTAINNVMPIP